MAKQYNPGVNGLLTEPNPADAPSDTLTDAENIIIDQDNKVRSRHGFNIKSTESPTNFVVGEALATNTTFIPSIPNPDVQVTDSLTNYVHYSSFFNGSNTFLKLFEFKNSTDTVLTGMLVKQNKNQFVTTDDGTNVTYLYNTGKSNPVYRYYKIDANSGKLVVFDEIPYSEVKNIFTTDLSTYLQTEDGIAETNVDDMFRPTANRFFTVRWPAFPKISHELNRSTLYGNWLSSFSKIGLRITFYREMGYSDKIEEVYESQPSPIYEIVNNGRDAIPSIYFDFQTIVDDTNLYKLWNDFTKLNNGRKFGIKVYRTKAVPITENLPADYFQCLDTIPFDTLFITKVESSSTDGNWHRFPILNGINIYKPETITNVLAINDMYSYVPYSTLSGTYQYVISSNNIRNFASYDTVVDLNDIIPARMQVIDKRSYAQQQQISAFDNFYNSSTTASNKITALPLTMSFRHYAFEFKNTDIDTKYINSIEMILTQPTFTMVEVNATPCTFINGGSMTTDYVDIVNSPFVANDIVKLKLANVGDTLPTGVTTTTQYRLVFQSNQPGNVTRYYLYNDANSTSIPVNWTFNGTGNAIIYKQMFNVPGFTATANQQLQVRSSGTLPTGLTAGTTYRAWNVSGNNFQLGTIASPFYSNDYVNVTSAGTGIQQLFLPSALGTLFSFQIWETSENSTSELTLIKQMASAQIYNPITNLTSNLTTYNNGTNVIYLGAGELNYRLKFNFNSLIKIDINKKYAMVLVSNSSTLPLCFPLENNTPADTVYRRVYTWSSNSLSAAPSTLTPMSPAGYSGLSLNFRMNRFESLYEYQLKSLNSIQISQLGYFYGTVYMPSNALLNSTTYSSLMNSFLIKNYKLELNINDDGIKDIGMPLYTNSNEDSSFYTNFIAPKSDIIAKYKDFYVYGGISKPLEGSLTVISQPRVEQNELTPAVTSTYNFYKTISTLSTTNGSADITFTAHPLTVGNVIYFPSTAPTPFVVNRPYYVVKTSINAFQIRDTTRTVSFNYSGSTGYIELASHGLAVNDPVMFITTPPAPFVKDRLYYVRTVPSTQYFTLGETAGAASDIVATSLGRAEMVGGGAIAATQTSTSNVTIRYQTVAASSFDFDRRTFFAKLPTEFTPFSTTANGELYVESAILGDRLNAMAFSNTFSSVPLPDINVITLSSYSGTPTTVLRAGRTFASSVRNIDHNYLSNNFYFGATLLEKPYLTLRLISVDNVINDFTIQTEPLYNRKGYYSLRDSANKYDNKALTYDLSFDEMNAFRKTTSNVIVRRGLDNIYHVVGEKEGQIPADGILNATTSFFINASSANNIFYDKTANSLTIKNPGTFDIKKFQSPGIMMIQSNVADIIIFSYQSIDVSAAASNTYVFKSVTLDVLSRNGISSTNPLENFIYNTEAINALTGDYFKITGMTYFFFLKGTSVNDLVLYPYANDVLVKSDGYSSIYYDLKSATDGTQNAIYEYYSPADNRGTNPTFTFIPHNKMSKKPVALFNKNKNFIFAGVDNKSVATYIDAYAWQIINKFNVEIQKRGINAYLYKGEGTGEIRIVYQDGQSIKIMNGKYDPLFETATYPGKHAFLPELNKLEFVDLAIKTDDSIDNNAIALSRRKIPEICPIGATAVVGRPDKAIIGYAENADDLYIFKEDGIFRITYNGDVSSNIPSVEIFKFSNNLVCQAAGSIQEINDEIIFLSQYGFISITNSGVTNISEKIQKDILQLLECSPVDRIQSFVNESKQLYYCTLINELDPTLNIKSGTYVFNTKTREWTFMDQEIINGLEDSKKRNLVAYRQKTILGTSNGESAWTYNGKTHKLTSCDLTYPMQTTNLINNFYFITREQFTNNLSQNAVDQFDYISENLSASLIETTANGFTITIDNSVNSFYFHYTSKAFKMGTPPSTIKLYPNDAGNTQYGIIDSPIQHLANREIYIQIKRTSSPNLEYYSTKLVKFTYLTNYKIKYEFQYLTTNVPADFASLESLYIIAGIPVKLTFNPESGGRPDSNKLFQEYMLHTETANRSAIMSFKTDSRANFSNDRRFAYDASAANRTVFRTYIPTIASRGRYIIRQIKHDVPLENLIITGQTIVMKDTDSPRVQKNKDVV